MIKLTRLNGEQFIINAELIRTVEEKPDTIVTLINGDRFLVSERMHDVVDLAVDYGRSLRTLLAPA